MFPLNVLGRLLLAAENPEGTNSLEPGFSFEGEVLVVTGMECLVYMGCEVVAVVPVGVVMGGVTDEGVNTAAVGFSLFIDGRVVVGTPAPYLEVSS